MKIWDMVILILLIGAIGAGAYTLILVWPSNSAGFKEANQSFLANRSVEGSNGSQFYPNMRYPDRRISYTISSQCDEKKKDDMLNAFAVLSQETILTFYESDNGEIEILCSDIAPRPEDKSHFIAGEGGPKDIVDTGLYHVIFTGQISLYKEDKCDEPKIALHELLHALGFDHNNNPLSVLYPVTSCDEQLDSYLIRDIERLYSQDSLPDLIITSARAQKTGRYLSFNVEITNQGLKDSGDLKLVIYGDEEEIKIIPVENIQVGFKKIITVDNLRVPLSAQKISFITTILDNPKEINLDNNNVELNLEEN